jgi:hypothetical protein
VVYIAMGMQSLSLLPALKKLPFDDEIQRTELKDTVARLRGMGGEQFAIELSVGVEKAMEGLFEARNVPDVLSEAYHLSFPNSDQSLYDHYQEIVERGPESVAGFISNLKGKVAELKAETILETRFDGYDFKIALDPNQPIWDLEGVGPEGTKNIKVQVKMGGEGMASDVLARMEENPDIPFAVSRELYDKILEASPELTGQLVDLNLSVFDATEEVEEGLKLLVKNFDIDVPDFTGEILPYVGEVVLGIRFLMDLISTEKDFKGVDLADRSRVHGMKALVLFSRFSITTICVSLGGAAASIVVPAPVVGTAVGALAGGGLSYYLNRQLKPRMMEIAMTVFGVDEDDMFYFKNEEAVDKIGDSLKDTRF